MFQTNLNVCTSAAMTITCCLFSTRGSLAGGMQGPRVASEGMVPKVCQVGNLALGLRAHAHGAMTQVHCAVHMLEGS